MTHPQYGKPETWPHRIRESDEVMQHTVEQHGRWSWWVVSRCGLFRLDRGPYWRRSTAEKVRRRLAEEDRP